MSAIKRAKNSVELNLSAVFWPHFRFNFILFKRNAAENAHNFTNSIWTFESCATQTELSTV